MSKSVAQWIKDAKYHFCAACGSEHDLQYHHLVPVSKGGEDDPTNIIVLCAGCHQKWHQQGGRDHHNYLVKDGIARARERGVKVGKPNADYDNIMRLIATYSTQFNDFDNPDYEPHTEREIMEMAGVKPVCYHKCKRMLFDAMNADVWPYSWPKPKQVRNYPIYEQVVKRMRAGS